MSFPFTPQLSPDLDKNTPTGQLGRRQAGSLIDRWAGFVSNLADRVGRKPERREVRSDGGASMEFVHEVTAYLENKPGRLAKICSALAHEKIDIRALSVMDTDDRSVLRFVTDRPRADQEGADVAGDRVRDRRGSGGPAGQPPRGARQGPGAARRGAYQHRICLRLDTPRPGKALGIFHTSNPKRAFRS